MQSQRGRVLYRRRSPMKRAAVRREAQQLNLSSALLALSVLADSGLEHYRGSFQNRAMYAPIVVSTLTLIASVMGTTDRCPRRHAARDSIYGLAAATGLAGLLFHTYNVTKRPGG